MYHQVEDARVGEDVLPQRLLIVVEHLVEPEQRLVELARTEVYAGQREVELDLVLLVQFVTELLQTHDQIIGYGHGLGVFAAAVQQAQFAQVAGGEHLRFDVDPGEAGFAREGAHEGDVLLGTLKIVQLDLAVDHVVQRADVALGQVALDRRVLVQDLFHALELFQTRLPIALSPLAETLRVIADGGGATAEGRVLVLDQRVLADLLHHGVLLIGAHVATTAEHVIDLAVQDVVGRQVAQLLDHVALLLDQRIQVLGELAALVGFLQQHLLPVQ